MPVKSPLCYEVLLLTSKSSFLYWNELERLKVRGESNLWIVLGGGDFVTKKTVSEPKPITAQK